MTRLYYVFHRRNPQKAEFGGRGRRVPCAWTEGELLGRRIRIVVGEGRAAQQGLLRFVLEGEGLEVVGEARTVSDLAVAVADGQPDVVVLDDGIGVTAVSMVREALPRAKIVLVWPSAVVPIGGDARVEPAKILNDLGAAVRQVAPIGVATGVTETYERPEWIDRIRKDPGTLRDKLAGKEPAKRPSVTQLQRRGSRLHPAGGRKQPSETPADTERAPVLPLPFAATAAAIAVEPATDVAEEPAEERSEWNRRLGTLALSGAAAVSALVLALALGGGPVRTDLVRGGGIFPPGSGFSPGSGVVGPFLHYTIRGGPLAPSDEGSAPDGGGGSGDGLVGSLLGPSGSTGEGTSEGPGGDTGGGDTGGGDTGGGNDGGGNNGGGGNGGGDTGGHVSTPEQGHGNPFGGPPPQLGLTPAHGAGLGHTVGPAADHAATHPRAHAHKH